MRDFVSSGHGLIAGFYLCIALVLQLNAVYVSQHRVVFKRLGAALFFIGCGLHHFDMAVHAGGDTQMDFTAAHHVIPVAMQLIGAPLFIWAVVPDVKIALPDLWSKGSAQWQKVRDFFDL